MDDLPPPAGRGRGAGGLADRGGRAARAEAFGAIVAAAFEMPPDFAGWMAALADRPGWTALLALDGDEPVGAAALFVNGRAAWLGMGATLPEHRGRGAQGALFAERIRRAAELGLEAVLTETGAPVGEEGPGPSYRNMLRYGFAEVALRHNLRSPG
ncbi:MAG TPA: GNAT family N-acetyltransferase [Miltoncostaeaceae bacterium]|nr:GNAT family N-acetyltransferase [Miltoncostaeaceae bacterium]